VTAHVHGDPDRLDELIDALSADQQPPPASDVLLAWWPVLDREVPWEDLILEADSELEALAARAHARIVGVPLFRYEPGRAIPGAAAYPIVLVARVPARRVDNLASARTAELRLVPNHHSADKDIAS